MKVLAYVLIILTSAVGIQPALVRAQETDIISAESLVQAIHERYAQRWPRSFAIEQKTTLYDQAQNTSVQTWYVAIQSPGKLRIDTDSIGSARSRVYANDSLYVIRNGQIAGARSYVEPMLVLGFDMFVQPAGKTLGHLREQGIDLTVFREDTSQGRSVYVVGAEAGNEQASQLWVDKEQLYVTRVIYPGFNDTTIDAHLSDYKQVGGGWIAHEVVLMQNGRRLMMEELYDVRPHVDLDAAVFDPTQQQRTRW